MTKITYFDKVVKIKVPFFCVKIKNFNGLSECHFWDLSLTFRKLSKLLYRLMPNLLSNSAFS